MANLNKLMLIGRLTRDPQLKFLPSQMAVAEWGMAVNHSWKASNGEKREEVCFIDLTAFGKSAELINQYCHKGDQLYVEARLKLEEWADKQTGDKRRKHVAIVENFQFLGGNRDGGGASDDGETAERPQRREPGNKASLKGPPAEKPFSDDDQQFKDDDIPF